MPIAFHIELGFWEELMKRLKLILVSFDVKVNEG